MNVVVRYADGTVATTVYSGGEHSVTRVIDTDGSSVSVTVMAGGQASITRTDGDGFATEQTVVIKELSEEPVQLNLSLLQQDLARGEGLLLLDMLRGVDSKVAAVVQVSGEGGGALLDGMRYDEALGRLYVRQTDSIPPVYALVVDRDGRVRRFKVQMGRVTEE